MSRTLQFKRLANTHLGQVIGANGEIIVDYTNDTLTVHDGQTLGGSRLATEKYTNTAIVLANSAFLQANAANVLARAAFDSANINYAFTQTLATNITLAYNQANTGTVLAQASFNLANTLSAASVDTLARTTANTATNNITIIQGVDTTQNTRITVLESVNTTQNTNITTVTVLSQAAFDKANTVVSSTDDYARTTANTATNNITIIQGVNTTQNTNISSANNIATAAFAKANTNISSDLTLTVTNSGSGAYVIDGASNPTLTLYRGVTYYFSINATGHPFYIQTVSGAYSAGNLYASGVTGAGTQVGTLTFTIPLDAPSNLYYVCQNHSAMNGAFLISNLISTINTQNTSITAAAQTIPQNAQTVNYTIQLTDAGKHIYYTQSTNTILYIPTTSNVAFANGSTIMIVSRTSSSANVTVSPNTGVSMYLAGNTTSASRNVTTYGMASLIQVAANTWFINGTGVS
jgi:hypothetical protein